MTQNVIECNKMSHLLLEWPQNDNKTFHRKERSKTFMALLLRANFYRIVFVVQLVFKKRRNSFQIVIFKNNFETLFLLRE